jgi:hypothetical protein
MEKAIQIFGIVMVSVAALCLGYSIYEQVAIEKTPIGLYAPDAGSVQQDAQ